MAQILGACSARSYHSLSLRIAMRARCVRPPRPPLEAVVHGLQVFALHAADGVSVAHLIVVIELGAHVSLRGRLSCRSNHHSGGWSSC